MKHSKFAAAMHTAALLTGLLLFIFTALYLAFLCNISLTLAITFGTIFYHIIMRLIVGALIPNRFHYTAKWFQPVAFEKKLYQFLRIKRWKKQLPTYDPTLFSMENYTLEQIVGHMCQAEVVHEVIALCSFIPLLFSLLFGTFWVFFITSVAAAGIDMLFVMLQRFNRPRLIRLMTTQNRRSPNA